MPSSSLTLLGIPGSLRTHSYSDACLQAMQGLMPQGVDLNVFDPHLLPLTSNGQYLQKARFNAASVLELKRQIREADAVVLAVPEYPDGLSTVLNGIIDCAAYPADDNAWLDKPVAMIGVTTSARCGTLAQQHLRIRMLNLGMSPIDHSDVLISNAHKMLASRPHTLDAASSALVCELLSELLRATRPSVVASFASTALKSNSQFFGERANVDAYSDMRRWSVVGAV
ncbi:MAG TPA: NAD(P)H-dependent oxidoreductase [Burkholderiaceae bacterium]|jgi:chromate reductase